VASPALHCTVQIVKTLSEQISRFAQVTLDSLAYSGTGNVLKVQELLAMCGEHIETEDSTAWKVGG
jgi:26S proteasome regulatory subunit N1